MPCECTFPHCAGIGAQLPQHLRKYWQRCHDGDTNIRNLLKAWARVPQTRSRDVPEMMHRAEAITKKPRKTRTRWNANPSTPVRIFGPRPACTYLDTSDRRGSVSCPKGGRVPLYSCELFGTCSARINTQHFPSCQTCPHSTTTPCDYVGKVDLRKYFPHVFIINLKRRQDRWDRIQRELDQIEWPFSTPVRFEAVDGKVERPPPRWRVGPGAWGCYQSHLRILKYAQEEGWDRVMIFEDDATFRSDLASRVREFFKELPSVWEMCYLGGQHRPRAGFPGAPVPNINVTPNIAIPHDVNRTHAMAFQRHFYDFILDYLSIERFHRAHHIDHHLGRLHQTRQRLIYCINPWAVGQSADRSNISGRTFQKDRFWSVQ